MLKYIATVLVGGTLLGSAAATIIDPARRLRAKEKKISLTANMLKNLSVTCRCGGLAVPTERYGRIRRCVRCNTQFSNSGYNLADLDMKYYDGAVSLLKEGDG